MARKTSQRIVYLVTAAIVVSMIGGFALATFQLGGQTNASYQGSQTTHITPLPGLSWVSTDLTVVPNSVTYDTCGASSAAACDVTSTAQILCVGSFNATQCAPSDFVEQVTLTTVVSTLFYGTTGPVTVVLTTFVTGTPSVGTQGTYAGPAVYFTESAAPTSAVNIVLDFDIGAASTGPGQVSSVSVVATT